MAKVPRRDNKAVVLLGASRIQLGINTQAFAKVTGTVPIQLAINGNSPMPVLRYLAEDDGFVGTVICSVTAAGFNPDIKSKTAEAWIKAYKMNYLTPKTQAFYHRFENWLRRSLRKHLTFHSHSMNIHSMIRSVILGTPATKSYITVHGDRSIWVDYRHHGIEEKRRQTELQYQRRHAGINLTIEEFTSHIQRLENIVDRIQSRGGKVIFLRLPTDGKLWEVDQAKYPKKQYWDRFASYTKARTIHFKDYPELSRFALPDSSHLDYRDAIPFTDALAKILTQREKGRS